jgi:cytochrome c oxidase cbb3-type subunit 3
MSNKDDLLREHVYDGIQEYDKRLPNWWLWTFYGTIIFSFFYWAWLHHSGVGLSQEERLERELNAVAMRSANSGAPLSDEQLWAMSKDQKIVAAGRATFASTCASCHGANLEGGIGANLIDKEWIHGGDPTTVVKTITDGVAEKGMPSWGPVLGRSRVLEVAAYVLSHHAERAEP